MSRISGVAACAALRPPKPPFLRRPVFSDADSAALCVRGRDSRLRGDAKLIPAGVREVGDSGNDRAAAGCWDSGGFKGE